MAQQKVDLTRCVGRVECGPERGTAFFLSVGLAVTCRHCILPHLLNGERVVIHVGGEAIDAVAAEPAIPPDHDVVLLRLARIVSEDRLLPLVAAHHPSGSTWETFGFPLVRAHGGMALEGIVAATLFSDTTPRDVELRCTVDPPTSFKGFSGSPVVMDGAARAVLQVRHDGGLGAISLWRLRGYLEEGRVTLRTAANEEPLAGPLQQELDNSVPNRRTFRRLETAIAARQKGYILLGGNPGTGKTLVVAGFQEASDEIAVVGRYFASGHVGSDLPAAYHGRLATFARWLSNEAGLRSREAASARKDSTAEQFTQSIVANLALLANPADGALSVLLIDGGEAEGPNPTEFIQYLPKSPPPGLAIVISTTSPAAFRIRFPDLQIADEVTTEPLPQYDCEWLAMRRLAPRLGPSGIVHVAQASRGHPLTLSYLIRDVAAALERGDADPLLSIESVPGGLEDYYARIWTRLSDRADAQYLLCLIARLRQGVSEGQLVRILPSEQQPGFLIALGRVRHLLRVDGGTIRLYHDSFREFVMTRSDAMEGPLHNVIARYCESAPGTEYSVANVLHHRARAGANPRETTRLCTQNWADRAAASCVEPELVISDVDEVLAERLLAGDLRESIRLLLLRSRIQGRYNRAFAQFAVAFARVTAALRSPRQALGFLFREGHYLCSTDETLTLLRTLSVSGHHVELLELFQEFRRRCWAAYEQGGANFDVLLAHMRATCILAASAVPGGSALVVGELRHLFWLFQENLKRGEGDEAAKKLMLSNARGALQAEHLWRTGFAACDPANPVELASALEEVRTIAWDHGYLEPRRDPPKDINGFTLLSRTDIGTALKKSSLDVAVQPGAEELVASNLMRVSDAFARVGELYTAIPAPVAALTLRAGNGVDPNLTGLQRLLFSREVAAFVADLSLSVPVSWTVRHEWERRFFQVAEWLGRVRGQWFRARALGEAPSSSLVDLLKREFFPQLRFSLSERSEWQDSYDIPERVVPRLMLFAADAVVDLDPASAPEFARCVLDHPEAQAGLYTEGYQRLLAIVADILSSTPQGVQSAADLRRTLRSHVTRRVFARQERVAGLLDCAQHLARLGAKDDAEATFGEAIRSSLGPAWYKEDQFRLMLDAVEAVNDREFSQVQWKKTVEILAYASGECTFQRFVRQQKDRLVKHLATQGLLAEALATYQHYVSPTLRLQRARVTRVGVDMTSKLSGDRFGVLEIDEQSGALALLSGAVDASPLRRWAVVELFWPWGDERYASEFTDALCGLLATGPAAVIGERFLRLLRADVEPARRQQFCDQIAQFDPTRVAAHLLQTARARKILAEPASTPGEPTAPPSDPGVSDSGSTTPHHAPDRPGDGKRETELLVPGLFGRRESLLPLEEANGTAQERISRGDLASARTILIEALKEAQRGGWDVWQGHSKADEALCRLFAEGGPTDVVLRALADLVLEEEHAASWCVAEKLLLAAVRVLDGNSRRELFTILVEHIECLIRPERGALTVAEELEGLPDNIPALPANDCLDELLLSQLDHPNIHMRRRSADVVEWLVRVGELNPGLLVDRVVRDDCFEGREVAVGILHRVAIHSPAAAELLAAGSGFERLTKQNDFLAQYLVEEIGGAWQGSPSSPPTGISTAPATQSQWSFDASPLLDVREGLRAKAIQHLAVLVSPLPPAEVRELADIRRRAFGAPPPQSGYAFERQAIFRAFAGESEPPARESVVSAVLWNPLWPDADLRVDWSPIVPSIISAVESGNTRSAFLAGDKTVLHCIELELPEGNLGVTITEVVAVLVPASFFHGRLDLDDLWEPRSTHQRNITALPVSILARLQEHAVARFQPRPAFGGDFTPAFPSRRLIQLLGNVPVDRLCWRDGRQWEMWGPGQALARGTATLIESAALSSFREYDLVWVVIRNEQPLWIVDPRRNQTHRIRDAY